MPRNVTARMCVPFAAQDGFDSSIVFLGWLPLNETDELQVEKDDLSLTLKFTAECSDLPQQCEDLSSWANPSLTKVLAEVIVRDVPDELVERIEAFPKDIGLPPEDAINSQHRKFGHRLLLFVLHHVNRLIAYVRHKKGQHALLELSMLPTALDSFFRANRVEINPGQSGWRRWVPPGGVMEFTLRGYRGDRKRWVTREDWSDISQFVRSSAKSALVPQLLSGAENLAENGHRRVALTQAVTALEVSVNQFVTQAGSETPLQERLAERMLEPISLRSLREKLGLRGTIRILLPLLFEENTICRDLLQECCEALNERQNIVHQGQRDVPEDEVREFLKSIRNLCTILQSQST